MAALGDREEWRDWQALLRGRKNKVKLDSPGPVGALQEEAGPEVADTWGSPAPLGFSMTPHPGETELPHSLRKSR